MTKAQLEAENADLRRQLQAEQDHSRRLQQYLDVLRCRLGDPAVNEAIMAVHQHDLRREEAGRDWPFFAHDEEAEKANAETIKRLAPTYRALLKIQSALPYAND